MLKINIKKVVVFFTALCFGALVIVPEIAQAYTCNPNSDCSTIADAVDKAACTAYVALCPAVPPVTAHFNPWGDQSGGIQDIGLGAREPSDIAVSIINVILGFLGIIAVLIILIGGFKWMTAGGNEDQVGDAKKWIYSGVIGLFIILAAYGLAKFAIEQLMTATGGTPNTAQ